MKRFTTHLVETQLNEENCSCCDNKIDADGKCGCGPDCEHCGGQHDVDEGSCGTVNASKKTVKEDYTAGSEKSQFGGHRAQLKNKEGKTSYLGAKAYKKPEHAAGEAQAYHDHYFKGRGGNERAADKAVSDYRNKNKKHMNESQDLTEGKMKDFHDMVNKGMSAAEIAKKIKMPVKDVADFMKGMKEDMKPNSDIDSHPAVKDARKQHKDGVWDGNVDRNGNAIVHIKGKPHTVTNTNTAESVGIDVEAYINEGGLWANIHAKRKRIKNGSEEKMKKPGSKGAPTDQDFKDASESVDLEEISKKTLTSYISKADKKAAKAGNSYSNAANRRHDFADDTPAMAKNAKIAQKRTDGADLARKKLNATYESVEEGLEQDGPKTKLGKSFGFGGSKAVDKYRKTKAQQRSDMNKKNDPGAAKKHLALSVVDREKADKKAKSKGTSMNKQWRMKMGYESVDEAASTDPKMGKAVQGLNDLGYKLKGRDGKDVKRIEALFRSGNKKVLQGAMRALDTDIRDQIMDILQPLGFVKNGVVESTMDEAKKVSDMTPEEKAANDKKRKEYNEYQKSKRNESLDEKIITYTSGHKPDPKYLWRLMIDGEVEGDFQSLAQVKSIVKNRQKIKGIPRKFEITRHPRKKLAGPKGKLPESTIDEARSSASDQAAKAGAYNGGKSGDSKGDGKSDLAHRLTGDALQKHRDKRSAEYEADLVKKRAANAARLKSYDESEVNDLTALYINENDISLDQLENMTEEELNELIGKAIGGAFKLGAKAVVGSARLASKGAKRMSTSGRADAANNKAAALEKKKKDRESLTKAKDRVRAAKDALRAKKKL